MSAYMSPFNIQKYYTTMMETSIILTVMDREVDAFKVADLEIYQIEGPTPVQNSDESPSEKSDNSCLQFALSNQNDEYIWPYIGEFQIDITTVDSDICKQT